MRYCLLHVGEGEDCRKRNCIVILGDQVEKQSAANEDILARSTMHYAAPTFRVSQPLRAPSTS
jgi:hypothetical protein